jgi:hypothetical protein
VCTIFQVSTVKCELMLESILKQQHAALNSQVTAFSFASS